MNNCEDEVAPMISTKKIFISIIIINNLSNKIINVYDLKYPNTIIIGKTTKIKVCFCANDNFFQNSTI